MRPSLLLLLVNAALAAAILVAVALPGGATGTREIARDLSVTDAALSTGETHLRAAGTTSPATAFSAYPGALSTAPSEAVVAPPAEEDDGP